MRDIVKSLAFFLLPVVRSAPHSRQPLSRVLGLRPPTISAGLKRAIYAMALAVPCAFIATAISDSGSTPDFVRYAVSPGLVLAAQVVHVETSPDAGFAQVFAQIMSEYATVMLVAFFVDLILFGLFIFGTLTTLSALTDEGHSDN